MATTDPLGPPVALPRNPLPNTTDPEVLAVAEAAWDYYDAFDRATTDPTNPQFEAAALATTTDAATGIVASILAQLRDQNLAARPNPEVPSRLEITEESIGLTVDGATAFMTGCEVRGNSTVTPGAGPDGSDLPASNQVGSLAMEYTLHLVDGRWLLADLGTIEVYPDQVGCP